MEVREYTEELMSQTWRYHCNSSYGRTSVHKLWATFKNMLRKRKTTNTCENFRFRNVTTKEQLVGKAGDLFFP